MIGYLTKEQSETVLLENVFGRIGCNDGYNTYIYPTNYVYDGKYIFCHSLAGSKINVMRGNKRVCFLVDSVKDFTNWKSVMVLGNFAELTDARDRYYALKAFVAKKLNLKISESVAAAAAGQNVLQETPAKIKPVIYHISIDEITGRFENE
jgi:nitroimidazol reductase NimA-like FMN-containing flavoprotein (pyridoxamine 5'-phosphate oxidase superfamily)